MVDFAIPVNDPRHEVAPNTYQPPPLPKVPPMPDNSVGRPEIGMPNTPDNSPPAVRESK